MKFKYEYCGNHPIKTVINWTNDLSQDKLVNKSDIFDTWSKRKGKYHVIVSDCFD